MQELEPRHARQGRRRGAARNNAKKTSNSDERPIPEDVKISIPRLLSYLKPYRVRMIVGFTLLIASTALGLVFPLIVRNMLDVVLEGGDMGQLNTITFGLLAIFFVRGVIQVFEGFNIAIVGERVVLDLRAKLFEKLSDQSIGFYTDNRTGEILSRMTADTEQLRTVLTHNILSLFSQTLTIIGSLILMTLLNYRLMLFIIVVAPTMIAIGFTFGQLIRRLSSRRQDAKAESSVVVEEMVSSIRVVKSFAREDYEKGRFDQSQSNIFQTARRVIIAENIFGPTMGFIGFAAMGGFIWFGGREVINGNMEAASLVAFLFYGGSVAGAIVTFVGIYSGFMSAIGATRRIFQIIDMSPQVDDAPDAVAMPAIEGNITLANVHFAYEADTPVLQDLSLDIQSGESVALVGPSGAGKTTLFNLIPRFYDPVEGTLRIDGHDLKTVTQQSLRSQIGIVPQDTQLFGGTIAENIRYGKLDATHEQIIAAATAANAHDFIEGFKEGYETIVGERGVKLSGGQRQRIAIARAILKNPRILLLDEATSSLDSASEALVQQALDRLMAGRTTIIIAHRLSTIQSVDRIAALEDGRLVELGTHAELLAKDGLYAQLYKLQFERNGVPAV